MTPEKNGKGQSNLQNRDFICLPAHMFLPYLGIFQQKKIVKLSMSTHNWGEPSVG